MYNWNRPFNERSVTPIIKSYDSENKIYPHDLTIDYIDVGNGILVNIIIEKKEISVQAYIFTLDEYNDHFMIEDMDNHHIGFIDVTYNDDYILVYALN